MSPTEQPNHTTVPAEERRPLHDGIRVFVTVCLGLAILTILVGLPLAAIALP